MIYKRYSFGLTAAVVKQEKLFYARRFFEIADRITGEEIDRIAIRSGTFCIVYTGASVVDNIPIDLGMTIYSAIHSWSFNLVYCASFIVYMCE